MSRKKALEALGYEVKNDRANFWSVENETGVCITIWEDELRPNATDPRSFDLWELHTERQPFEDQEPHRDRIEHLKRAEDEFDSRVDVVIIKAKTPTPKSGQTGREIKTARPWIPKKNAGAFWKIRRFCPKRGFFRAVVVNS